MERKEFIKNSLGFLGAALVTTSVLKAREEDASCSVTNTETGGPFPTITPSSLVKSNIRSDRTGVAFSITITVKNINASCNILEGAIVDIWHCDKDGLYSEYGGTSMQATDYTSVHFLRGRQTTDSNGQVTFTSIFPGWYQSRATHIHVHIYNSSGTSLLISQIAFPEASDSAVVTVNSSTANGYTKGMTGYTYNSSDNVFSDGVSNEMSTITGNITDGYDLTWDAYVAGPVSTGTTTVSGVTTVGGVTTTTGTSETTGIAEVTAQSQFIVRQNYPNPANESTTIPFVLKQQSNVIIELIDLQGRLLKNLDLGVLAVGDQQHAIDLSGLASGRYVYSVKVSNASGNFKQSKMLLKN